MRQEICSGTPCGCQALPLLASRSVVCDKVQDELRQVAAIFSASIKNGGAMSGSGIHLDLLGWLGHRVHVHGITGEAIALAVHKELGGPDSLHLGVAYVNSKFLGSGEGNHGGYLLTCRDFERGRSSHART